MKTGILILSTLIMFSACTPPLKLSVSDTRKIEDISKVSFFYSLPRTVLQFHIYAEKTTLIRGPFAGYAQEYLGITEVIEKNEVRWNITHVSADIYQDADPNELYAVKMAGKGDGLSSLITLSKQGLIADINLPDYISGHSNAGPSEGYSAMPYFKDVSVKRNFSEKKDTLYKTLFVDTAFIKVPVIKSYLEMKTEQQKAEEAANFIIKTRKRRFKLLSGQYDYTPEEKSLEICVDELNQVEEEYISLFIGKTIIEQREYVVEYIPGERAEMNTDVLLRFSEEEGLWPVTSKLGQPLHITLKLDIDPVLDRLFEQANPGEVTGGIIYRIPAEAEVKVLNGREELFSGRVLLSQLGYKVVMPLNMVK